MDRIQDTCKTYGQFISDELIKEIWALTETNSVLRRWVIDLRVYQMYSHKGVRTHPDRTFPDGTFRFIKDGQYRDLWKFLQVDFDLFKAFISKFESMAQQNRDMYDPRTRREKDLTCFYHSHTEAKCGLEGLQRVSVTEAWVDDLDKPKK
jgi:hypothetical protein